MDWKNRCNPCIIIIWIFAIIVKTSSLARTLSPVEWDMTNLNFFPDGITIEAEINDVIDIICPQVNDTEDDRGNAQYHTFTQVPYDSYSKCELDGAAKLLIQCNRPFVENKYTLLFQAWTPYPRGSTFEVGQDYYYITTSSGSEDGLDESQGGLCRSHNMRLRVHIKETATSAPRITTTRQHTTTTPLVHTTTRRTVERTKRPPLTDEPIPTKMGNKNKYDKQQTDSANRYQTSSLLLLISCLIARIRWH